MGRKGDNTGIVFRDPCSVFRGGQRKTAAGEKRFGIRVNARARWGAAVLRPYTRQVLEFAQGYGYWASGGADGWRQAADDTHY